MGKLSKSSDNHHESNILTESSTSSSQRKSTEEIDKSELVSKEILYANDPPIEGIAESKSTKTYICPLCTEEENGKILKIQTESLATLKEHMLKKHGIVNSLVSPKNEVFHDENDFCSDDSLTIDDTDSDRSDTDSETSESSNDGKTSKRSRDESEAYIGIIDPKKAKIVLCPKSDTIPSIICEYCAKPFQYPSQLQKHIEENHQNLDEVVDEFYPVQDHENQRNAKKTDAKTTAIKITPPSLFKKTNPVIQLLKNVIPQPNLAKTLEDNAVSDTVMENQSDYLGKSFGYFQT